MRIAEEQPSRITELPVAPLLVPDSLELHAELRERQERLLADLITHIGVADGAEQAQKLLSHFGSLNAVFQAEFDALAFAEIRDQFLCQLLQKLRPLLEARDSEELIKADPIMSHKALKAYALRQLRGCDIARGIALFFDRKCRPLGNRLIFDGDVNRVEIYHIEILKKTVCLRASYVATLRNNPAGTTKPTGISIRDTHELRDQLSVVKIAYLDHVIVAGNEASSFREQGLL